MNKSRLFSVWIILAGIVTVLTGLIYASVQQSYRQGANDPQIEITEEISQAIGRGAPGDQIIPPSSGTDVKVSLAAFAMVFDKDGKVIGSSAKLNGKDPVPPKSVFENAKKQGRNVLTWEPEKGTRIATVIVPAKGSTDEYFILAGRNIREIEKREHQLLLMCAMSWVLLLLLSALLSLALGMITKGTLIVEKETDVVVIEETPKEV